MSYRMHPLKLRYLKLKAREWREILWLDFTERSLTQFDIEYERKVREEISQQCKKLRRKLPLQGNVAVRFDLLAGSRNVGPLEIILKKHIDLLYPPRFQTHGVDFSNLTSLLHNDTQVEYISANYHHLGRKGLPTWRMIVIPIGLISEWCKLIRCAKISDPFGDDFAQNEFRYSINDDSVREFFRLDNEADPQLVELYRNFAQRGLLERNLLTFNLWSILFERRKSFKIKDEGILGKLQELVESGEINLRRSTENIIGLMSVGGYSEAPSKKQTSKAFFNTLREKTNKSPYRDTKMKRWELPISLSCFYRPPSRESSYESDLDNITRHVIREVNQSLKPPRFQKRIQNEKQIDVGIDHFECKRIGKATKSLGGEICFVLQPIDTATHFWDKLNDAKRALEKLKDLEYSRWRN